MRLEEFRRFVEGSTEEVFLARADGRIVWASETAVRSLGYAPERLFELSIRDIAPGTADSYPARVAQARQGGPLHFSVGHLTADGATISKELRILYVEVDGEGHLCAFAQRSGSHRQAEVALRQVERLYAVRTQVNAAVVRTRTREALFEAVCRVAVEEGRFRMAWVGLRTEDDRVVPVAQAGHVAGYLDSVEISARADSLGEGPTGTAVRTGTLDLCSDFATDRRMAPWRAKAMSRGYLASAAVPFRLQGRVIGALTLYAGEPGFFTKRECTLLRQLGDDLSYAVEAIDTATERARLETELARASRLEAIGRLAGGVGHDFNNMLTVILSGLGELEAQLPGNEVVASIRDAATRSAQLTRQLLTVARRGPAIPTRLALDGAIDASLPLLRKLAGPNVELRFAPGAPPLVKFDPAHLDQVLTNLTTNARDAMESPGVLRLLTSRREFEPIEAARRGLPAGACAELVVADDGPGMPPAVLERVFEPFFTTKGEHGTGLGLATVYGLVRQAGGHVEVASSPGQGTRLTLLLPAA